MIEDNLSPEEVDKIEDEMLAIARRLREKYDLTSVVILGNRQTIEDDGFATQKVSAVTGNVYSSKFQALKWSKG